MFPKCAHSVRFLLLFFLHATVFKGHAEAAVTTVDCARIKDYHFTERIISFQIKLDEEIYTLTYPNEATKLINKINEYKEELAKQRDEIKRTNEVSIKIAATLSKLEEPLGKIHSSLEQQINEIKDLEKQSQSKDKAAEAVPSTSIATNVKALSEGEIRKLFTTIKDHAGAAVTTDECAPHGKFNLTEILVAKSINLDGKIYNLHKHNSVDELVKKINEYKKELKQLMKVNEVSTNLRVTLSNFEETIGKVHNSLQQQMNEIKDLEKQITPIYLRIGQRCGDRLKRDECISRDRKVIHHVKATITSNPCTGCMHKIKLDGRAYYLANRDDVSGLILHIDYYKRLLDERMQQLKKANGVSTNLTITLSRFKTTLEKVHNSLQQQINGIKDLEKQHISLAELNASKGKAPEVVPNPPIGTNTKTLSEGEIRNLLHDLVQQVQALEIAPVDETHLMGMIISLTQLMEISTANEKITEMFIDTVEKLQNEQERHAESIKLIEQKEKDLETAQGEVTALETKRESEIANAAQQLDDEKQKHEETKQKLAQALKVNEGLEEENKEVRSLSGGSFTGPIIGLLKAKITRESLKDRFWAALDFMCQLISRGPDFIQKLPLKFWAVGTSIIPAGFSPGNVGLGLAARPLVTPLIMSKKPNTSHAAPAGNDKQASPTGNDSIGIDK
ncbi:hypothetical protein DdX_13779 [Ditylenchus destructor]|uniref:Uncharacterized protein n=1 Tax=Ditylenchus destructor TaxID=166010 RepID=A0AAD4MVT8_9BILA|nr:hypothetical protein DdX_13779 [Ditylenchus destructor]